MSTIASASLAASAFVSLRMILVWRMCSVLFYRAIVTVKVTVKVTVVTVMKPLRIHNELMKPLTLLMLMLMLMLVMLMLMLMLIFHRHDNANSYNPWNSNSNSN